MVLAATYVSCVPLLKVKTFSLLVEPITPEDKTRPCESHPCGINAQCADKNGVADCSCPDNYVGNPNVGCRPECVLNSDCGQEKSCAQNRCVDPCASSCASNSECRVVNHNPICSCIQGYSGDPYSSCSPIPAICKLILTSMIFQFQYKKLDFLALTISKLQMKF